MQLLLRCYLCYVIGSAKPSVKKLQQMRVITAVSSKWYELGIALLDEDHLTQLDIIKANNNEVTRCCAEMFMFWLKSHSTVTWQDLIKGLEAPGVELNDVAAMVEKQCSNGLYYFVVIKSGPCLVSYNCFCLQMSVCMCVCVCVCVCPPLRLLITSGMM